MIDWVKTDIPRDIIKNKDQVIVTCEQCSQSRQQLYQVAKRKSEHICLSCSKSKNTYKTNELVEHTCISCGLKKTKKYRPDRYKNWKCHKCGMIKAHLDGKFNTAGLRLPISESTKEKISEIAKKRWEDPEYVAKWKITSNKTKAIRSFNSKRMWEDPVRKRAAAIKRANQPRISSIQNKLYDILSGLGIEHIKESEHTVFGHYTFDCLLPNKILIEVQGDYWHTLEKNSNNDRSKFTYMSKYYPDYQIVYIWEEEFRDVDKLKNRLSSICGIANDYIDFSFDEVELAVSSKKDVRSFLDAYHYIGGNKNGFAVSAKLNGEIIACSLYSPPIRQNVAQKHGLLSSEVVELSRLCIHPSRHKKNFATWFIARSIGILRKHFEYKLLLAYSDHSVGHRGTVYKASNFKFSHVVPPDYWYIDESGYVIGKKRVYDRAIECRLTERQYIEERGYIKKYGGSKRCFIKHL